MPQCGRMPPAGLAAAAARSGPEYVKPEKTWLPSISTCLLARKPIPALGTPALDVYRRPPDDDRNQHSSHIVERGRHQIWGSGHHRPYIRTGRVVCPRVLSGFLTALRLFSPFVCLARQLSSFPLSCIHALSAWTITLEGGGWHRFGEHLQQATKRARLGGRAQALNSPSPASLRACLPWAAQPRAPRW